VGSGGAKAAHARTPTRLAQLRRDFLIHGNKTARRFSTPWSRPRKSLSGRRF